MHILLLSLLEVFSDITDARIHLQLPLRTTRLSSSNQSHVTSQRCLCYHHYPQRTLILNVSVGNICCYLHPKQCKFTFTSFLSSAPSDGDMSSPDSPDSPDSPYQTKNPPRPGHVCPSCQEGIVVGPKQSDGHQNPQNLGMWFVKVSPQSGSRALL